MTTNDFARNMYEYYSNEVGDAGVGGTTLPTWDVFRTDPVHKTHYQGWWNTMAHGAELLKVNPLVVSLPAPPPEEGASSSSSASVSSSSSASETSAGIFRR